MDLAEAEPQQDSTARTTARSQTDEVSVHRTRHCKRWKALVIAVIVCGVVLLVLATTIPLLASTRGNPETSVIFYWSKWGSWEPHNVTCGHGTKVRMRNCTHDRKPCQGPSQQTENSQLIHCKDCREWSESGSEHGNGVYTIDPDKLGAFQVYCDMTTDGGGWTVFQRRQDGSEDFYRSWNKYKTGFGNLTAEFWLGNEYIHRLTTEETSLRVDLEDWGGNTKYAKYGSFKIEGNFSNYKLRVRLFSGTAADSLNDHNAMEFSTKDNDNDVIPFANCAQMKRGAWWYKACHDSNLNGLYMRNTVCDKAVTWHGFNSSFVALKFTEMKLRWTGTRGS